jgi:hypothetical protein
MASVSLSQQPSFRSKLARWGVGCVAESSARQPPAASTKDRRLLPRLPARQLLTHRKTSSGLPGLSLLRRPCDRYDRPEPIGGRCRAAHIAGSARMRTCVPCARTGAFVVRDRRDTSRRCRSKRSDRCEPLARTAVRCYRCRNRKSPAGAIRDAGSVKRGAGDGRSPLPLVRAPGEPPAFPD